MSCLRRCLIGDLLDREIGDVIGQGITDVPKLFTYARYNAELSRAGLNALGLADIKPANVQQMDSVDHISEMQQVGRAVAKVVTTDHFAAIPACVAFAPIQRWVSPNESVLVQTIAEDKRPQP